MGKYQQFVELPVWQESARLYQSILDMLEEANLPLSASFRTQLERSALAISSNIAGSFDRMSTVEMIDYLTTARGAAAEVQSMAAVVIQRPKLARLKDPLQRILTGAESCAKQLSAWINAIEHPNRMKQTSSSPNEAKVQSASPPH